MRLYGIVDIQNFVSLPLSASSSLPFFLSLWFSPSLAVLLYLPLSPFRFTRHFMSPFNYFSSTSCSFFLSFFFLIFPPASFSLSVSHFLSLCFSVSHFLSLFLHFSPSLSLSLSFFLFAVPLTAVLSSFSLLELTGHARQSWKKSEQVLISDFSYHLGLSGNLEGKRGKGRGFQR